jgi:hypothetical protein
MTRIDGLAGHLTGLLRRRLGALKDARGSGVTAGQASANGSGQSSGASSSDDQQDIGSALMKRVQMIGPEDPERERKAFRAFLESMLLAELGESLINDAGFYEMVDHIHQQMESDPDLAAAIHEAAALLLGEKRP